MADNAIVKADDFALMKIEQAEFGALVKENMGSGGFSQFDLGRVRVPAAGGTTWEVETLEGPAAHKEIAGVILHFTDPRRFWEIPFGEGDPLPPDCSSVDGEIGTGVMAAKPEINRRCDLCPYSKFGSDVRDGKPGKGQRCKQMRQLMALFPDAILPQMLLLPPTSIKPCRQYFLRLLSAGLRPHQVLTKFTLQQVTHKEKPTIKYSIVAMAMAQQLTPEHIKKIEAYRDALMPHLRKVQASDAEFVQATVNGTGEGRDAEDQAA